MKFINKKKKTSCVIAFMGVDGSGKSTIIDKLINKLSNRYKKIKYLHLRPYLFLIDKRTVVNNPHNIKIRPSKLFSLLKIIWWLLVYNFFFFFNKNNERQLIIFDRYAHDLLIDPLRYQFNLTKKLTRFILSFFPEPDIWIILTASVTKIEKRKKELPTNILKIQIKSYINFAKSKKNSFIVNTNLNISKNLKYIEEKIILS